MKKIFAIIAYKALYGAVYSVSLMPITFLYTLSSLVYGMGYYIFGYRKSVVIQNVSRSFPEKKYGEVRSIVKQFYLSFTAYFAEIIKSLSINPKKLGDKISFNNLELIDSHINAGKNVIVCLGHCGNWEMLNFMPYLLSHDMYAIYKPLHSDTMNRFMMKLRSRFGMKLLPDKSVTRHILTNKESPSVYLFLSDQCPILQEEKYKFEFMNQITYFFSGMEKLARLSKSAVVYLHITQSKRENYTITCKSVCANAENTPEGAITLKYIDLLTENIIEQPHAWLWSHKRWKR